MECLRKDWGDRPAVVAVNGMAWFDIVLQMLVLGFARVSLSTRHCFACEEHNYPQWWHSLCLHVTCNVCLAGFFFGDQAEHIGKKSLTLW